MGLKHFNTGLSYAYYPSPSMMMISKGISEMVMFLRADGDRFLGTNPTHITSTYTRTLRPLGCPGWTTPHYRPLGFLFQGTPTGGSWYSTIPQVLVTVIPSFRKARFPSRPHRPHRAKRPRGHGRLHLPDVRGRSEGQERSPTLTLLLEAPGGYNMSSSFGGLQPRLGRPNSPVLEV